LAEDVVCAAGLPASSSPAITSSAVEILVIEIM
jgi:hypothetical protein